MIVKHNFNVCMTNIKTNLSNIVWLFPTIKDMFTFFCTNTIDYMTNSQYLSLFIKHC